MINEKKAFLVANPPPKKRKNQRYAEMSVYHIDKLCRQLKAYIKEITN